MIVASSACSITLILLQLPRSRLLVVEWAVKFEWSILAVFGFNGTGNCQNLDSHATPTYTFSCENSHLHSHSGHCQLRGSLRFVGLPFLPVAQDSLTELRSFSFSFSSYFILCLALYLSLYRCLCLCLCRCFYLCPYFYPCPYPCR